MLGDWFGLVGSAALLAQLSDSGLAIGALFIVRMLAPPLLSPIAGVCADRYSRRRILIITDVVRAIAVLGLLLVQSGDDVWLLYVLNAVILGISAFFFSARSALLPDIVSDRELGAANALSSATWSVMLAVGAAVGGLVAGVWGPHTAFLVNAGTFALSGLMLLGVSDRGAPANNSDGSLRAGVAEYVDGLRYVINHRDIFAIALNKPIMSMVVGTSAYVVMSAISTELFVLGEAGGTGLGLMMGVTGAGTGVGPILLRWLIGDNDRSLRRGIVIGYVVCIVALLLNALLISFDWVLATCFLRGCGTGVVWVFTTQLLMQQVARDVRGRVFSSEMASANLTSSAGTAIVGVAFDVGWTIGTVLVAMAIASALPLILWVWWMRRGSLRTSARS